jgi:hypothetical protein
VIESSAFFVTLLFIVTQKPAGDPLLMFIGVLFVTAALAAFLAMIALGENIPRILSWIETMTFSVGLLFLAIRFIAGTNFSLITLYATILVYALGGSTIAIVVEIFMKKRRRERYRHGKAEYA